MLLPLFLLLGDTDPAAIYNGRAGQLDVQPPRLEAEVVVDGTLDEGAWSAAAMLTGFSQFTPVDGVAAADSTEVLGGEVKGKRDKTPPAPTPAVQG